MDEGYQYKTRPYLHQEQVFERSRDMDVFALLMEQGTGKSKVIVDTAAYLFQKGRINGLLIVAPMGVHRNWAANELPTHMPDNVHTRVHIWSNKGKGTKKREQERAAIVTKPHRGTLDVLILNVDAYTTDKGREISRRFLDTHLALFVLDESSRIKTPSAKRTRSLCAQGERARYRRILTGTPVTQSPLDIYAQFKFLSPRILGHMTFTSFKAEFAVEETEYRSGGSYQKIIGYKNLEDLTERIDRFSYRVTKAECLDLPPKVYEKVYVEMGPNAARVYSDLKENFIAELKEGHVAAPVALTRLMRLQQVLGGFLSENALDRMAPPEAQEKLDYLRVVTGENGPLGIGRMPPEDPEPGGRMPASENYFLLDDSTPRLKALIEVIEDLAEDEKVIVWARFRPELDLIAKTLGSRFGFASVVQYHGGVPELLRAGSVSRFQDPKDPARFFVGQPRSGGIGLTLTAASAVVYYSNDFSLETRLQSEDRAHRIGQHKPVLYYDLECEGTVDSAVLTCLREKKNLADLVTGDNPSRWI